MITIPQNNMQPSPLNEPRPEAVAIGFSCRAIAESLMQTRRRVAVIDCCGDLDTRLCTDWVEVIDSLDNTRELISMLERWFTEFGVLPLLLGGATENHPELLTEIKERWPESLPNTNWNALRDWKNWREWAKEAGFPTPQTLASTELPGLLANPTDVTALAIESFAGRPVLLKNLKQSGGLGVTLHANLEEIALESGQIDNSSSIVQQALPGRVLGVHFFSSSEKNQVLGVVEGIPTENHPRGEFVYLGSRGPVHLRAVEVLLLERFADIVTRETGLMGTWNADFIETQQGWHLLEINPRWSAGLEVLEMCAPPVLITPGEDPSRKQIVAPNFAIKRIVYANADIQVSKSQVQSLVDASLHGGGALSGGALSGHLIEDSECVLERARLRVADIPMPDTNFSKGMPVCTLIATGNSREDASKAILLGRKWLVTSLQLECF